MAEIHRWDLARNKHTKGKLKGKVNARDDTATDIQCDVELIL